MVPRGRAHASTSGKKSGRADCIVRAIRLVQMFQTRREVTVRQIMDEFGIKKQSAQVWLDAMSLIYPVYEIREERRVAGRRNTVPQRAQKVYGLAE